MKISKSTWIFCGIIAFVVLSFTSCYNGLVSAEENVNKAWSDVEVDYQRRMDVITKVSQVALTAVNKESKAYKEIIEARSKATSMQLSVDELTEENIAKFEQIQQQNSGVLSRLLAVQENYPELQSISLFRDVEVEIEGTENRIKESRRNYNDMATRYNIKLRRFPTNFIANMFGFQSKGLFHADPGAEKSPELPAGFTEE